MIARLNLWLGAALTGLSVLFLAWVSGRREGGQKARVGALRADADAHRRINEADLGIGASDADNVRWLRDFHAKHKR